MKKILVIVNEFFPEFSANSNCLKNVLYELKKEIKVDVLTFSGVYGLSEKEDIDGISVNRIDCKMKCEYNLMYSNNNKKKGINYLFRKILNKLLVSFIWPDFGITCINRMKKKAKSLVVENDYDAIVTSSGDFLAQYIGLYLRKTYRNIRWMAYFNDPMPSNNFLYKRAISQIYNIKKLEKELLINSDIIIFDKELYKENKDYLKEYKEKIITTGISNLILEEENNIEKNNIHESIKLVFMGTLDKNIRNPERFLEIVTKCSDNINVEFYGGGDCIHILNKYTNTNKIKYRGIVEKEIANNIIKDATILVNISNTVCGQVPCKLFEYMSTGKPIINIVKNSSDVTIGYIERYKNGINLFEKNELDLLAESLEKFCFENKNKVVDLKFVKEEFFENTPENTANIIKENI